jgi:low affinity Fe/Cu permease
MRQMSSDAPLPPVEKPPSVKRWWLGSPLLVVIALYVLPLVGSPLKTNPNELVRVKLAVSIAYLARVDVEEAARIYGLSEDVALVGNRVFCDKAPGLSILAVPVLWLFDSVLPRSTRSSGLDVPAYWPMRHLLTFLLVGLPTVGLSFLIAAIVPLADGRQRSALAVIIALATPLWTYATVFFGHAPAAALITLAWILLLAPFRQSLAISSQRAVLGGVAAGIAFSTEYPTVLIGAVIFITLLVRRAPMPVVARAAYGAAAGALPALIYNQIAFGVPWLTGYSFKASPDFRAIHSTGLFGISWPSFEATWGVLFSASRGIFFFCPLLLLAPVGLWWMIQRSGWRDAAPITAATTAYILFAAGFRDWTAGWCAAARHLVPIIPLLALVALDAAPRFAAHRVGRAIVVILVAVSGVNTVLTIALTPFFPPEFSAPLAQLVLPSLADGAGFPNLVSAVFGVAPRQVLVVAGSTALAVLAWATGCLVRWNGWRLPAVFATTVSAVVLGFFLQGSRAPSEIEFLRAQMLRRLGQPVIADRIENDLVTTSSTQADMP